MSDLRASVSLAPRRTDVPTIEHNQIRMGDLSVMLPIEKADAAAWCRDFALLLEVQADLLDVNSRADEKNIASAISLIAEMRRNNGELADDGWCWDCKADKHDKHRTWIAGGCAGCSCTHRTTQPHGTDRAPDTERSEDA